MEQIDRIRLLEIQHHHAEARQHAKKGQDRELTELKHNQSLMLEKERQYHADDQAKLFQINRNKELLLKSETEYLIKREDINHKHNLSAQEHKQLIEIKRQELDNEVTLLNGKYEGNLALAHQELQKELTLQKESLTSDYEKSDMLSAWSYKHEMDKIRAETQAYQEKEDSDLDRRFLENKELLNNELIKLRAEMVRMTHETELQKNLDTHRAKLAQSYGGVIDKQQAEEWVREFIEE